MSDSLPHRIAIVGATGAVGLEALAILAERAVSADRIGAFASPRSVGTTVPYADGHVPIQQITPDAWHAFDTAIFCVDAQTSRRLAPPALRAGVTVIDNSSAFRLDPRVPLVVPEINAELLDDRPTLVANPNCSTILLLTALEPIRRSFSIERITLSTYQAVSGAGLEAIAELRDQTRAALDAKPRAPRVFPHPCAFNVFPHESPRDEHGYTQEERKIIDESAKIWPAEIPISPTCVRVPVERAHSQAIVADLAEPITREQAEHALRIAPAVRLMTDSDPTPLQATGKDDILIGRVRIDPTDPRRLLLWVCADQLRKGAALNAIQIAEHLHRNRPTAAQPDRPAMPRNPSPHSLAST